MGVKELANHISRRVVLIGTTMKHFESVESFSLRDAQFAEAFSVILLSLQNTLYIEMFKLFDGYDEKNNKKKDGDAYKYSVYALIECMGCSVTDQYPTILEPYKKDIMSLKRRRNKIFGHDLGQDVIKVCKNTPINHRLQDLLSCVIDICCEADPDLFPSTYVRNAFTFEDWCSASIQAVQEITELNDKIMRTGVTSESFYAGLNDYLASLLKKNHKGGA